MVQIAHSGSNEEKIKGILLAAQKRFGLYGYGKTTMSEIAEDLGMSKASLYYYFPDKDNLFRAVFEKEKQEFIDDLHEIISKSDDAVQLLYDFIALRSNNFKLFINLSRASFEDFKGIKNVIKDLWLVFLAKEKDEIRLILTKGVEKGDLNMPDISDTASLLVDSLRGISHIYMHHKNALEINEEDFSILDKKIKLFMEIFIKGISK
jgi:AcrR family transcriptional regulator